MVGAPASGPCGPFAPGSLVAVGGSRALPAADPSAGLLAQALVRAGHRLVVGCAVGADAAVIGALAGSPALQVLAAFGPVSPPWPGVVRYSAPGAWSGSAVAAVARHLLRGGRITWWAGGGPHLPLVTRLAARTQAVASACTGGALVVLASPRSRGSLLLAQAVARRGLPVVAVPLGFPVWRLPRLGGAAGRWLPLALPVAGAAQTWCWHPLVPGNSTQSGK